MFLRISAGLALILALLSGCRQVRYGPDGGRIAFRKMDAEGDRLLCTTLDHKPANLPKDYFSLLPPENCKKLVAVAVTSDAIQLYWPENEKRTFQSFDELVAYCNRLAAPDCYFVIDFLWSGSWPADRRKLCQAAFQRLVPEKYVSLWGSEGSDWLPKL